MDDGRLDALGQTIVGALPGAALEHVVAFNQLTVTVEASRVVEVARYLRDDPAQDRELTDPLATTVKLGRASAGPVPCTTLNAATGR